MSHAEAQAAEKGTEVPLLTAVPSTAEASFGPPPKPPMILASDWIRQPKKQRTIHKIPFFVGNTGIPFIDAACRPHPPRVLQLAGHAPANVAILQALMFRYLMSSDDACVLLWDECWDMTPRSLTEKLRLFLLRRLPILDDFDRHMQSISRRLHITRDFPVVVNKEDYQNVLVVANLRRRPLIQLTGWAHAALWVVTVPWDNSTRIVIKQNPQELSALVQGSTYPVVISNEGLLC